ncbi:MAG: transketolase, partial [Alphaproteobacteria bacterium]
MTEQQTHGRNVSREFLEDRAKFIRLETVRLTKIAGAGHYSSTFSAAELLAALYYAQMRINP